MPTPEEAISKAESLEAEKEQLPALIEQAKRDVAEALKAGVDGMEEHAKAAHRVQFLSARFESIDAEINIAKGVLVRLISDKSMEKASELWDASSAVSDPLKAALKKMGFRESANFLPGEKPHGEEVAIVVIYGAHGSREVMKITSDKRPELEAAAQAARHRANTVSWGEHTWRLVADLKKLSSVE